MPSDYYSNRTMWMSTSYIFCAKVKWNSDIFKHYQIKDIAVFGWCHQVQKLLAILCHRRLKMPHSMAMIHVVLSLIAHFTISWHVFRAKVWLLRFATLRIYKILMGFFTFNGSSKLDLLSLWILGIKFWCFLLPSLHFK